MGPIGSVRSAYTLTFGAPFLAESRTSMIVANLSGRELHFDGVTRRARSARCLSSPQRGSPWSHRGAAFDQERECGSQPSSSRRLGSCVTSGTPASVALMVWTMPCRCAALSRTASCDPCGRYSVIKRIGRKMIEGFSRRDARATGSIGGVHQKWPASERWRMISRERSQNGSVASTPFAPSSNNGLRQGEIPRLWSRSWPEPRQ
jgi:hypothetical protein